MGRVWTDLAAGGCAVKEAADGMETVMPSQKMRRRAGAGDENCLRALNSLEPKLVSDRAAAEVSV